MYPRPCERARTVVRESTGHYGAGRDPKELQRSALDAVRQWTYKPFLLNGAPVEVKTTIEVTYFAVSSPYGTRSR